MLCGNSDFIDGELLENYRSVGVAHIFAVSGLHIGFLALVLKFILSKIKMNRFVRAFLIIFVLLFYSGVCGFSSSSIRATIMCAVSLIASAVGKKYDRLSSVSFALIIVLMIWPVQLFSLGFQLSFGVVFGIILLSRPIANILRFLPRKLSISLSSVISAQLTSLPICLYAFKEFSAISVIANLIFIPIVGFVFIFLFVSVLLSLITGLGGVFLFLPSYVVKGINYLFSIADYKIFMIGGVSLGAFGVVYYLALIISSQVVNLK
jgi:competence protein ComEC